MSILLLFHSLLVILKSISFEVASFLTGGQKVPFAFHLI